MDITLIQLPHAIYAACFVFHNFCELQHATISEDCIAETIAYDREFQLVVEKIDMPLQAIMKLLAKDLERTL